MATSAERAEQLAAFWRSGPLTWNEAAASTVVLVALALLGLCLGALAADARARHTRGDRDRWLDVLLVLVWSFVVRFVIAEPNIFIDGGSTYSRLLRYVDSYGGIAALIQLLPAEWSAFLWRAMLVPRSLAALAPGLLVWVGRELGLGRGPAVLAGVMLASLPVHAALTASDLLVGPMSSLQLAAVALLLAAQRRDRLDWFAAGIAIASWAMWCRPEGLLSLLPSAVALLSFGRRWWGRWDVRCILAGGIVALALRAIELGSSQTFGGSASPGILSTLPWGELLSSTILLPVWLWAPAPLGLAALYRSGGVILTLAGMASGLIPAYLRGLGPDPAGTHLEAIRYGLPALPWLALLAGIGLHRAYRRMAGSAAGARRFAFQAALVLALASPALLHREYLERRYGHAASEAAILELLPRVPDGCGLLAPDDHGEGITIEVADRYAFIAAEWYARGGARRIDVRPVSELLEGQVRLDRCWTFMRGPYCYHAAAGRTAISCQELEQRFDLEEIASVMIEFRHLRLVTGPTVERPPWYMKEMPIVLYRVVARPDA